MSAVRMSEARLYGMRAWLFRLNGPTICGKLSDGHIVKMCLFIFFSKLVVKINFSFYPA
jgi:hypothetical protein